MQNYFLGETRFYVVFVLVNNYQDDVFVTITRQSGSYSIELKPGETIVVSEQPNNQSPFTVEAEDATGQIININENPSFSLTPRDSFGFLDVLYISRPTQGRCCNKFIFVFKFV